MLHEINLIAFPFFLSNYTGSLIHEHYTRECDFGNFDKIKKKKHKKQQHKNFWLNFCLNKECPKLLCGLGICHRRRQTIPMWNSSGGGGRNNDAIIMRWTSCPKFHRHVKILDMSDERTDQSMRTTLFLLILVRCVLALSS